MQTFPFFAALVLTAHFVDRHDALTVWGPTVFGGRVGYVQAAAGYGLLRSTLFFNATSAGIVLLLIAISP